MPFTCPRCHLTFDLPDGKPARPRAEKTLQTMCPNCSHVIEYLESAAGHVNSCPKCYTKIKLPGGPASNPLLELADEKPETTPAPRPQSGGLRGKRGFGRAIVPLSGPRRRAPGGDGSRARTAAQIGVLLLIAAGIVVGILVAVNVSKKTKVDRGRMLENVLKDYIAQINFDNAEGLAQMCWGSAESRAGLVQNFRDLFAKVEIRVTQYELRDVFAEGEEGRLRMDLSFQVTDKAKSRSKSYTEERTMIFRWKDGRFWVVRPIPFPTEVRD
jgi:hypothetical protein